MSKGEFSPLLEGDARYAALANRYVIAAGELLARGNVLKDADILTKAELTPDTTVSNVPGAPKMGRRSGERIEQLSEPVTFEEVRTSLGEAFVGDAEIHQFIGRLIEKGYAVKGLNIQVDQCTRSDLLLARKNGELAVRLPLGVVTDKEAIPLNIQRLRSLFPEFFPGFPYEQQRFVVDTYREKPVGLAFISKYPLPGTVGAEEGFKTALILGLAREAQAAGAAHQLISPPTATEVALTTIMYYISHGSYPFSEDSIETASRTDRGNIVYVGWQKNKGLVFEDLPPGKIHPKAGFYSSR